MQRPANVPRWTLVAVALLAAILTGVVPTGDAFSGFGHPAVVIIALVLIVSRGLSNSGGSAERVADQLSQRRPRR